MKWMGWDIWRMLNAGGGWETYFTSNEMEGRVHMISHPDGEGSHSLAVSYSGGDIALPLPPHNLDRITDKPLGRTRPFPSLPHPRHSTAIDLINLSKRQGRTCTDTALSALIGSPPPPPGLTHPRTPPHAAGDKVLGPCVRAGGARRCDGYGIWYAVCVMGWDIYYRARVLWYGVVSKTAKIHVHRSQARGAVLRYHTLNMG